MSREEAISAAVDAACAAVWPIMHRGSWPEACPNPDEWREEERQALMPALAVLEAAGWLLTDEHSNSEVEA